MNFRRKTVFFLLFIGLYSLTIFSGPTGAQPVSITRNAVVSEIQVGLDLGHLEILNSVDFTKIQTVLEASSQYARIAVTTVNQSTITKESLKTLNDEYYDIYVILGPKNNFTEDEIGVLQEFTNEGNALLLASTPSNPYSINDILKDYGVTFTDQIVKSKDSLGRSVNYSIITRLGAPITPVTENITKLIFHDGTDLQFSEGSEEAEVSDIYPLFKDSINNANLSVAIEFEKTRSRIMALGSASMFKTDFLDPVSTNITSNFQNTDFLINAIHWLGKATGRLEIRDYECNYEDDSDIPNGERITGSGKVYADNQITTQVDVQLKATRTLSTLTTSTLHLDNETFSGSIETEGFERGWIDVIIRAEVRGYFSVEKVISRSFILPVETPFIQPDLTSLAIVGSAVTVGIISIIIAIKAYFKAGQEEKIKK